MKRELKGESEELLDLATFFDRKAHPDEKGTERQDAIGVSLEVSDNRKAHPDEKGTESYVF